MLSSMFITTFPAFSYQRYYQDDHYLFNLFLMKLWLQEIGLIIL